MIFIISFIKKSYKIICYKKLNFINQAYQIKLINLLKNINNLIMNNNQD